MSVSSGSDRIAFEEQPAGPAGPTGPTGPAGPAGPQYQTATTDSAASAGEVARRVSGGHVEKATGGTVGSGLGTLGLYGGNVTGGGSAQIYGSGSRCPVAGLPVGELWRSNTGTAVLYGSLVVEEYSNRLGYSDGAGVDVNIGPEEQVL